MTNESGARPQPSIRKVPSGYTVQTKSVTPGYGTDNNNSDSAKMPYPAGSAPDTHVNTPEGKPFA